MRRWWWYLNTWLFYYGYHPKHFKRIGWRLYCYRPRNVILSKRFSVSSTAQLDLDPADREWTAKLMLRELKRDMTKYRPFVARWDKPVMYDDPITGDFRTYTWVVEGEKKNKSTNVETMGGEDLRES